MNRRSMLTVGTVATALVLLAGLAISGQDTPLPDGQFNLVSGHVQERIYLGDHQRLLVGLENGPIVLVKAPASVDPQLGHTIKLTWPAVASRPFAI